MPSGLDAQSLEMLANFASVVTAGAAVFAYGKYRFDYYAKSKKLEKYLRLEKDKGRNKGQRSLFQIVRDVGLTEDEIIK